MYAQTLLRGAKTSKIRKKCDFGHGHKIWQKDDRKLKEKHAKMYKGYIFIPGKCV